MSPMSPSRRMWEAVERFHGICYVAPEVRQHATAAGLKGFWMNYFATRVAPVGPVGPDVVQAAFFYYGPKRVHRAVPDAWEFAAPESIIAARYVGMGEALDRLYGTAGAEMGEAAALARTATERCDLVGRILHAGWSGLSWPADPGLALWHACTLLREYRSGNHLIALASEGLDGCEAVVSHVAVGGAPRVWIRDEAGWSEADEARAVDSLKARGWLDEAGAITDEGRAGRARVENLTDQLDAPVWEHLGAEQCNRLSELLDGLNSVLPPDDQLDWEHVYGPDGAHG